MKKISTFLFSLAFTASFGQTYCSLNPSLIGSGLTVSGEFKTYPDEPFRDGIAYFTKHIDPMRPNYAALMVYQLNGMGIELGWSSNSFDLSKIRHRVVSGDFDNDGYHDDIVALYDEGNGVASIKTWSWDNANLVFDHNTIWTTPGYWVTNTTGRVVSGDFDGDGIVNDIAAFYDYGNLNMKVHVWKFDGLSTSPSYSWFYQNPTGSGYNVNMITHRVVSGDFDHDNVFDDIAVFYNYGNGAMRIHMFSGNATSTYFGNGSAFSYTNSNGWWSTNSGYDPNNISMRVVSGNFDRSSFSKSDDIIAFYDYGNNNVKVHLWSSTGNSFNYSWQWQVSGFDCSKINGRVVPLHVSGRFSTNEHTWGIGAIYDYGTSSSDFYFWNATGLPATINSNTTPYCPGRELKSELNFEEEKFNLYPNPSLGEIKLSGFDVNESYEYSLFSFDGRIIISGSISSSESKVFDLSDLPRGTYFIRIDSNNSFSEVKKIVLI